MDCGSLPRAVGAKQAESFAWFKFQADVVHGLNSAEGLPEVERRNHGSILRNGGLDVSASYSEGVVQSLGIAQSIQANLLCGLPTKAGLQTTSLTEVNLFSPEPTATADRLLLRSKGSVDRWINEVTGGNTSAVAASFGLNEVELVLDSWRIGADHQQPTATKKAGREL